MRTCVYKGEEGQKIGHNYVLTDHTRTKLIKWMNDL